MNSTVCLCGLCSQQAADDQTTNRRRRSLDGQQLAPPGEYFRYKLTAADSSRRGQAAGALPRSSAMRDLLKRNWEDIAMSAWG